MGIANCTRCNKVFRKTFSPLCAGCYQQSVSTFSQIYRFVQDNPQLTLEDIAFECHVSLREIEELFFKGGLGTASGNIISRCQRCGIPLGSRHQRGRFCQHCTARFAIEAGLHQAEASGEILPEALPLSDLSPKTKLRYPKTAEHHSKYGFGRYSGK